MQPGLDGRHRPAETLGERLAARAMIVGEQDDRALLRLELVEAGEQRREPFRALAGAERIDRSPPPARSLPACPRARPGERGARRRGPCCARSSPSRRAASPWRGRNRRPSPRCARKPPEAPPQPPRVEGCGRPPRRALRSSAGRAPQRRPRRAPRPGAGGRRDRPPAAASRCSPPCSWRDLRCASRPIEIRKSALPLSLPHQRERGRARTRAKARDGTLARPSPWPSRRETGRRIAEAQRHVAASALPGPYDFAMKEAQPGRRTLLIT